MPSNFNNFDCKETGSVSRKLRGKVKCFLHEEVLNRGYGKTSLLQSKTSDHPETHVWLWFTP